MVVVDFATPTELAEYVVTNTILQSSIVNITVKDGRWYLFYM